MEKNAREHQVCRMGTWKVYSLIVVASIPGCRKEQENAALYAGAKFVGSQVSKDSTYEVEVTLKVGF